MDANNVKILTSDDYQTAYMDYLRIKYSDPDRIILLKCSNLQPSEKEVFFPFIFKDDSEIEHLSRIACGIHDLYNNTPSDENIFSFNRRPVRTISKNIEDILPEINSNHMQDLESCLKLYIDKVDIESKLKLHDLRGSDSFNQESMKRFCGNFVSIFLTKKVEDISSPEIILDDIVQANDGVIYTARKPLIAQFGEDFFVREVNSDHDFSKYFSFLKERTDMHLIEPEIFFDMRSTIYNIYYKDKQVCVLRYIRKKDNKIPIEYTSNPFEIKDKSIEVTHLTSDRIEKNIRLMELVYSLSVGYSLKTRCDSMYVCVKENHEGVYNKIGFLKRGTTSFDGFDGDYSVLELLFCNGISENRRLMRYTRNFSQLISNSE